MNQRGFIKIVISVISLIFVGGISAYYFYLPPAKYWFQSPRNFEECKEANRGAIIKTKPAKCQWGEGIFVEAADVEVPPRELPTDTDVKQVPPSGTILPTPRPEGPVSTSDRLKAETIFVTVDDLMRSPNTFLDKKVKVNGKLINTKQSYFPSPEFAIADRVNDQIRFKVTAWLPFEVPPPPPGSTREQPRTMQSYLDRIVNLVGIVKQSGSSFYLEVSSGEYAIVD